MNRRGRVVAWRALALTCSLGLILTLIGWAHSGNHRWWWYLSAAFFTGGVWACEKAAQRVDSRAWRQRLDRFGDNP